MSGEAAGGRWGAWGAADERGALNQIGPEQVLDAVALVRTGEVIELGQALGPETPVPAHRPGVARFMNRDGGDYAAGARRPGGFQFAEDTLLAPTHAGTHMDALAHAWYDDLLYNGFAGDTVRSTTGAARCGIDKVGPVVARGVLADVASGTPLEVGYPVTRALIEDTLKPAGLDLRPGDVVLVRTGWLGRHGSDAEAYFAGEPGVDVEAARWLADAGVAAVGADNFAVERIPFPEGEVFPVHQLLLRDRGVPLIEGLELDRLAASGAAEFLFVALPLAIEGGTASPLAPVAVL